MSAYQRGDYREKRVKEQLEARGYIVWQTRGSHGVADIVALKRDTRPLLVQVKTGSANITHSEWNKLYRLAMSLGAIPVVVTMDGRFYRWRRIEGEHAVYTQTWPARALPSFDRFTDLINE